MIWTHGGAFKIGNGRRDLSEFILSSNKSIVGVTIQYRVSRVAGTLCRESPGGPC